MNLVRFALAGLALAGACSLAQAKPIAFSHGTTVMAEYGAGTMLEAQVFYAPKYFLSLGGGYLELESDIDHRRREISVRACQLPGEALEPGKLTGQCVRVGRRG